MHGKHLFEYAFIRAVPRVERQEFINVGVILYCRSQRFLDLKINLNQRKINCLDGNADIELFKRVLNGFKNVCEGSATAGPIGRLPAAERFRWLTASRSTIIQTSPVHPGFCVQPSITLEKIFLEMVTG